MLPPFTDEDFPLDFLPADLEELFAPEERPPVDLELRELPPFVDPREFFFAPPELLELLTLDFPPPEEPREFPPLDFFEPEDFDPERFLLPPDDFFPEPPPDDERLDPEDFELLFFEPLPLFPFAPPLLFRLGDFLPLIPTAREAAPAT